MKKIITLLFLALVSNLLIAAEPAYQVQKDDTLASILRAQNYGDSYSELLPFIQAIGELNPDSFPSGDLNRLFPGSVLIMPDNPNKPLPEPEPVIVATPEPEPVPEPEPAPEPEPEPVIGWLLLKQGTASVSRGGEDLFVGDSFELLEKDVVTTGMSSLADIQLTDTTQFQLGPVSELDIEKYNFPDADPANTQPEGALVTTINQGVIRTISGLLSRLGSNEYRVSSALTSTIGVRGTDFTVRTCLEKENCGDLYGVSVAVQDGGISFKNSAAEIALKINEFAQMQSATDVPVAGPIPEGFFDLELNVNEIKTSKNIWQKVLNWFESL